MMVYDGSVSTLVECPAMVVPTDRMNKLHHVHMGKTTMLPFRIGIYLVTPSSRSCPRCYAAFDTFVFSRADSLDCYAMFEQRKVTESIRVDERCASFSSRTFDERFSMSMLSSLIYNSTIFPIGFTRQELAAAEILDRRRLVRKLS